MGAIRVDAQSEEQEGNMREGFYACKGVPWVPKTELHNWPDQWLSEVTNFSTQRQFTEMLPFKNTDWFQLLDFLILFSVERDRPETLLLICLHFLAKIRYLCDSCDKYGSG